MNPVNMENYTDEELEYIRQINHSLRKFEDPVAIWELAKTYLFKGRQQIEYRMRRKCKPLKVLKINDRLFFMKKDIIDHLITHRRNPFLALRESKKQAHRKLEYAMNNYQKKMSLTDFNYSIRDDYILEELIRFPELMTSKDLVELGIFKDVRDACITRQWGQSPFPWYVTNSGRVFYSRKDISDYLRKKATKPIKIYRHKIPVKV